MCIYPDCQCGHNLTIKQALDTLDDWFLQQMCHSCQQIKIGCFSETHDLNIVDISDALFTWKTHCWHEWHIHNHVNSAGVSSYFFDPLFTPLLSLCCIIACGACLRLNHPPSSFPCPFPFPLFCPWPLDRLYTWSWLFGAAAVGCNNHKSCSTRCWNVQYVNHLNLHIHWMMSCLLFRKK